MSAETPEKKVAETEAAVVEQQNRRKRIILALLILTLIGIIIAFLILRGCTDVLSDEAIRKPHYRFSIYGRGKIGALKKPIGVAVNQDTGTIYVTDRDNARVVAFDSKGKPLFSFNKTGENTKLQAPVYLAINKQDNLYVSDRSLAGIYIFDEEGKFLRKFKPDGKKNFVWNPLGLCFDKNDNLYVTDVSLQRVLVFNSKGKQKKSLGKIGATSETSKKKGRLYFPNGIAVGEKGYIYITDSNNRRIQIVNPKGKFVSIISTGGLPRGIATRKDNKGDTYIYVVDALAHHFEIFSKKGELIFNLGEQGMENGEFLFPNGLALKKDGTIYITDRENNRVQVWK